MKAPMKVRKTITIAPELWALVSINARQEGREVSAHMSQFAIEGLASRGIAAKPEPMRKRAK